MATRGQLTWTEKNKLATERLESEDLILYFGDNDEKGREIIDVIGRDLTYRGCDCEILWVAVTRRQEERFGLPRDARIDGFNLPDLRMLIEEIVTDYIDLKEYELLHEQEEEDKQTIRDTTITYELPDE